MTGHGATSEPAEFAASAEAASASGFGRLRHVATTGSTNTDLVEEARAGEAAPCVLVADHQTAGRGRLDRVWEDLPSRTLLVSLRVPTSAAGAHDVVAAVGCGARAAVDRLVPAGVAMKWPNDLVVVGGARPGKLAGVLAEFVDGTNPVVVVGLGCNIETVPTQPDSTSVIASGGSAGRDEVLASVIVETAARLASPSEVHDELRRHSATLGSRVRVELPGGEQLTGTATDLRADGRLVVEADDGTAHVIGTGDVVSLRPAG